MPSSNSIVRQIGEDLLSYVYRVSNMSFKPNRWGSSQYASMVATYDTLERMIRSCLLEAEMWQILDATINLNQFDVNYQDRLLNDLLNRYENDDEISQKVKDFFDQDRTLDQIFDFMRESAWDLWKAIPFVFRAVFPNSTVEADKVAGVGLLGNKEVQSNNVQIGIQAWLLSQYAEVDDKAFHNFDT